MRERARESESEREGERDRERERERENTYTANKIAHSLCYNYRSHGIYSAFSQ